VADAVLAGKYLSTVEPSVGKIQQLLHQLNPSQTTLLESTAKEFLLSGGFGSGKTAVCVVRGILLCQAHAGTSGFIGRETYPTVRKTFLEWVPPEWGTFRKSEGPGGTFFFHNGSEVVFRHFDQLSEEEIKSLNLGWAFIDQAEDVPEATYLALFGRLRQVTLPKTMVWLTANPKPGWLKRRFVTPTEKGEASPERVFLNVPTTENQVNLPDDYIDTMLENFSESWIKRYVYASWDAFEGLVYPDFNVERHVRKSADFSQHPDWPRTMVLDYGLRNPTHANAYCIMPDATHGLIGEYRANNLSIPQYAEGINRKLGPHFPFQLGLWCDPSMKQRTEKDRPTFQEMFSDEGLPFIIANNDFQAAYIQITKWLKHDQFFVLDTCPESVQEFQEWEWEDWSHQKEDKNLKETPKDRNNHSMDCTTYYANVHATPKSEARKHQSYADMISDKIELDTDVMERARAEWARKRLRQGPARSSIY
jgi:hypothetical protein